MEQLAIQTYEPAQHLHTEATGVGDGDNHVAICHKPQEAVVAYLPSGGSLVIDATTVGTTSPVLWWFNPRTGTCQQGVYELAREGALVVASPTREVKEDWVLIINHEVSVVPIQNQDYYLFDEGLQAAKMFDW